MKRELPVAGVYAEGCRVQSGCFTDRSHCRGKSGGREAEERLIKPEWVVVGIWDRAVTGRGDRLESS